MKSFTIFEEYFDLITLLPTAEEQQELLFKIAEYMFNNKKPNLNENQMKIFKNLKRPLDKSKEQSKRRTKKEPNENQKETKKKPKENTSKMSMSLSMSNVYVNSLYEFIESNFGRTLNPIEYEEISKWEDNDLTRYAITQAVLNNAYSIKYIEAILNNWKSKGIKTVVEAQKKQKKKNDLPDWFDKEIESKELEESEEGYLKEMISKYE